MEAARLMLRGKETDYAAARKRAARWLSRRKVDATDMPTAAEIQLQLYALSGLFAAEHQTASLAAMRGIGRCAPIDAPRCSQAAASRTIFDRARM